jgi:hypothetical protein
VSTRRPNESEIPAPRTVELDPHPPAYKTPVPTLPRAPRVPSDAAQLLAHGQHDTDPSPGDLGVDDADEKTPNESPHSLKRLSEKMDRALAAAEKSAATAEDARHAARDAANNSLTMMGSLKEMATELKQLGKRVDSLEVSQKWAPLLMSAVALCVCLWLSFRIVELQQQLTELHHVLRP